jgi:putative flavoprotein involved in K+ transport
VERTAAVIIGGGQAGLAMSRCLSELGIEHVVLERGEVAQRWRSQSWDSLRLLTPNWMTRLPGFHYDGPDPDGFMSVPELVAFFERYAASSRAPVVTGAAVSRVEREGARFRVVTSRGVWLARTVVIATGYCDTASVPGMAARLHPAVDQLTPGDYRRPDRLAPGGVLVVGASATGVQLADEIQRSGRQVTLAVGRHLRLPRRYRGRDILWWLDRLGALSRPVDDVYSIEVARRQPSMQLVGRADHASVDVGTLHAAGVRLVGRVLGIDGPSLRLDDDLAATTAAADIKMAEILGRVDQFIARGDVAAEAAAALEPTWPLGIAGGPDRLDLHGEGIETVIWATGYRRAYPWLRVPVLDGRGEIRHAGGVTPAAGLYVLGLNFQRRRHSSFIDGVGDDARVLAQHIAQALARRRVA